jgi:hypothetical protein
MTQHIAISYVGLLLHSHTSADTPQAVCCTLCHRRLIPHASTCHAFSALLGAMCLQSQFSQEQLMQKPQIRCRTILHDIICRKPHRASEATGIGSADAVQCCGGNQG